MTFFKLYDKFISLKLGNKNWSKEVVMNPEKTWETHVAHATNFIRQSNTDLCAQLVLGQTLFPFWCAFIKSLGGRKFETNWCKLSIEEKLNEADKNMPDWNFRQFVCDVLAQLITP